MSVDGEPCDVMRFQPESRATLPEREFQHCAVQFVLRQKQPFCFPLKFSSNTCFLLLLSNMPNRGRKKKGDGKSSLPKSKSTKSPNARAIRVKKKTVQQTSTDMIIPSSAVPQPATTSLETASAITEVGRKVKKVGLRSSTQKKAKENDMDKDSSAESSVPELPPVAPPQPASPTSTFNLHKDGEQ